MNEMTETVDTPADPQIQILIDTIEELARTSTLPDCTDDNYLFESFCHGQPERRKSIYGTPVPEGATIISDLLYQLAEIDLSAGIKLAHEVRTNKSAGEYFWESFSDIKWILPDGSVFRETLGLGELTVQFGHLGKDGVKYLVNVKD